VSKIAGIRLAMWGELRDRIPDAKLKILPSCGHDASSGCPDAVNAAILEFCAILISSLTNTRADVSYSGAPS